YQVQILNATPEQGLATQLKDVVVQAGWAEDAVIAGEAGSQDFPTTTVFYSAAADEAAAKGLAEAIGGAATEQSDAYVAPSPDVKQLTIVVGLDRTAAGQSPTPAP
ncbi:MAG TPA: LytR C-terminal domain-containing protein, partial [Microbacterium sp.]|nr:LytR C-terminal domain-containing protein [Microbacterium sp.]